MDRVLYLIEQGVLSVADADVAVCWGPGLRTPIWRGTGRSAKTPIPGLYLASSYAGSGGFTGAILAGGTAADLIL